MARLYVPIHFFFSRDIIKERAISSPGIPRKFCATCQSLEFAFLGISEFFWGMIFYNNITSTGAVLFGRFWM